MATNRAVEAITAKVRRRTDASSSDGGSSKPRKMLSSMMLGNTSRIGGSKNSSHSCGRLGWRIPLLIPMMIETIPYGRARSIQRRSSRRGSRLSGRRIRSLKRDSLARRGWRCSWGMLRLSRCRRARHIGDCPQPRPFRVEKREVVTPIGLPRNGEFARVKDLATIDRGRLNIEDGLDDKAGLGVVLDFDPRVALES